MVASQAIMPQELLVLAGIVVAGWLTLKTHRFKNQIVR